MPSIICKCKCKLSYGEIPNSIEWLTISDLEYDKYQNKVDAEELYMNMKSILKCNRCGRLWIFWDGFESEPISYLPEI